MTSAPHSNYILHTPVFVPAGFAVERFIASPNAWGGCQFMGFGGTHVDQNEPGLIIAEEQPYFYFPPFTSIPKGAVEEFHLRRFDTDHRMSLGRGFMDEADKGDDPPDFHASTGGESFGVECTSLTPPGRRELMAFFKAIRMAVAEAPIGAFSGLMGSVVQVAFTPNGANSQGKPFKPTDYASIEALLRAMHSYRVDLSLYRAEGAKFPEKLNLLGIVDSSLGTASFHANPLINATPDTPFYAARGFELVLTYSSSYRVSDADQEVRRLVVQHDKPGVDVILISCGAPNREGVIHPSEEAFAAFYLDHGSAIQGTQHIQRVLMHRWDTGEAWDLLNEKKKLFGPIYAGTMPRHRMWAPSTTSYTDSQ